MATGNESETLGLAKIGLRGKLNKVVLAYSGGPDTLVIIPWLRQYREQVKDLSCLSKNLRHTVIVDNNPFSFLLLPLNGIPCVPFSAGQPYDDQLSEVLLPLLKLLSSQKDAGHALHEKFHMPEWFQKQGILASCWT